MKVISELIEKRSTAVISLVILFFLLIYLSFPTNNSTIDSYGYSACIKYSETLFYPHHLLYNVLGYLVFEFLTLIGINTDALALMKIINSIFAVLSLFILKNILARLEVRANKILSLIIFVGSSFGVMRFATENETYIIPIFFSLLGSYYFLKYLKDKKEIIIFLSSIFGAFGCLFHQIHFAWWFGIFISLLIWRGKLIPLILYILPALIVPVAYIIVLIFYQDKNLNVVSFINFVFEEVNKGNVTTSICLQNFLFTAINLFRTFFQVHGYMFVMIKKNIFYMLPAIISLSLIAISIIKTWKFFSVRTSNKIVTRSHLLIFLFHLILAFYAVGNAEFMVMIPFLIVIIISGLRKVRNLSILLFSLSLLIWNFLYGVFPSWKYDFTGNDKLTQIVVNNPDKDFILKDKVLLENRIYYSTGINSTNIYAPPYYFVQKGKVDELTSLMKFNKNKSRDVITDCVGNEEMMSRAVMVESKENTRFFSEYKLISFDSIKCYSGTRKLYLVK